MGLDMYLFRREKGNENDEALNQVAYWRKANQIRSWFARATHIENCELAPVTKEMLVQLRQECKAVLKHHDLADSLLPTSNGFFFGSTEYGEWYFEDLKETVDMLSLVINETDWEREDVYYYEWW